MAVTLMQIAENAGVSHTTVSRVLNGKATDFISRKTREKVLKAALDLGYQPYRRRRPDAPSKVFALWVPEVAGLYAEIQVRLHRHLAELGHDLVTVSSDSPGLLRSLPLHGVFAFDVIPYLKALQAEEVPYLIPVICLGNEPMARLDSLTLDIFEAARQATARLIERGGRRVAMVLPGRFNTHGHERRDGYLAAVADAGLAAELIETATFEPGDVRAATRDRFREADVPDSLFCFSDQVAMGALAGLREAGRRVPEAVQVMGIDGLLAGDYLTPTLSTMVMDIDRVCVQACRWMEERLTHAAWPPRREMIPYIPLERGSTRRK